MMFEMTAKNVILRILLYFGVAFSFLAVMALVTFVSVRTGLSIPIRWIGLAVFTGIIGWFVFDQYRVFAQKPVFWLTTFSIMAAHVLAFVVVLLSFPRWPLIWFLPVTLIEIVLIALIFENVFDGAKH